VKSSRALTGAILAAWCGVWVASAQQNISPPPNQQRTPLAPSGPATPPSTAPQTGPRRAAVGDTGGFMLENVSLAELIDIVARRLKINYLLDPHFKGGSVTIHTYGEVKQTDLMPLLETILRVNGAALVKVGDLYRVVPVEKVSQMPIAPLVNGKDFPEDERMTLNLIFLKYATAGEILKLIQPFLGEGAAAATYDPANLLILQDNNRSMKRTMDLLALFDNDAFVSQRVHLFEVSSGRPTDLVKQLDAIFKAVSLSDKTSAVKFVPIDRINTIVAVAPNPGVFDQVGQWLKKLDIPVKSPAGSVDNYVYRLKYGRADSVAMAVMALYSGNPMALMALSQMNNSMMNSMMGNMAPGLSGGGMGGYGNSAYGGMGGMGGMGGYGNSAYGGRGGMGGYGNSGYGGMGGYGGYGGMGGGMGGYGGMSPFAAGNSVTALGTQNGTTNATGDQTGTYLGAPGMGANNYRGPHIIPNPFDNTLLVQSTPEEWEQISRLLAQLDVPPRQILVEAKIFEVTLTGDLSYGVESYLQAKGAAVPGGFTAPGQAGGFLGSALSTGLNLTGGLLVGHSRELLSALTALESTGKVKTINEPSLIATDSVPAVMNVGTTVPTLSSVSASGVQSGGNTLFANNISNVSTGVTLIVNARVNSSGIVTMMIDQEVSAPGATSSQIESPTFSNRSFQTQITVQDGDTIGIGGIIQESLQETSAGIPFLQRIPILGAAFGAKTRSTSRTELIAFFTPHVIYDTASLADATDDLKSGLKHMKSELKQAQ
jgi:general secretion pathway protein D